MYMYRERERERYRPSKAGAISSLSFLPPHACSREIRNRAPNSKRIPWPMSPNMMPKRNEYVTG